MTAKPKEKIICCQYLTNFNCDLDTNYCALFKGEQCTPKDKIKSIKQKVAK